MVWRAEVEQTARKHLLQHYERGDLQEDIALATWYPAEGMNRTTAVIDEVLLPTDEERVLKGNVQMTGDFLRRCRNLALAKRSGIAVMHNHLGPGWQGMSRDDVVMERRSVFKSRKSHWTTCGRLNTRYRWDMECALLESQRSTFPKRLVQHRSCRLTGETRNVIQASDEGSQV